MYVTGNGNSEVIGFFFFFSSFCPSHFLYPSVLSPSYLIVATQIRGHIAGSFPTLPTTVRALHFYRVKISALSSLVDSRRIVLTHARRSQQLILFLFIFANTFKICKTECCINSNIVGLVHAVIIQACMMYHAACKVEFQPFKRQYSQLKLFNVDKISPRRDSNSRTNTSSIRELPLVVHRGDHR